MRSLQSRDGIIGKARLGDEVGHFRIIGISTDDYPDRANAALQASNTTISHFIDTKLQVENMLGASRIPLTVLVDADGRVIKKVYGAREWDSLETQRLVAQAFGISDGAAAQ